MAVISSTLTCMEEHSQLKQTTNLWDDKYENLIAAPARLQRMLLRLQQYNMTIMYRPDKEMLMADALNCLLHGLTHRSSLTKELMPYPFQLSQGAAWPRLQQKHNGIPFCQQYTDWLWMVAPTDTQMSPESPETISMMNSQSRMIYSWKVNEESSSHHPTETLSWTISTEAMQESTMHLPWLECVSTGQGWKQIWQTISRDTWCVLSAVIFP